MKRFSISRKIIIWIVICALSALIALTLFIIRGSIEKKQLSQQMAQRWSDTGDVAQISCFFSREQMVTENQLIAFEYALDDKLKESSITVPEDKPDARLWQDAYSASANLSVSTDRASLYLKAIGVGGEFFQFHPQELRYGYYFSDRYLNKDYVVIDEEIAWQLFGGINVAGKFINVNGEPCMISGVIKRPQGKLEKAAGEGEPIIYVSMETLKKQNPEVIIDHYEIVMPNPIKDFAMDLVKDKLSVDAKKTEYIENTNRFSVLSSLKLLKQFGTRSMNTYGIIYPYWENLAKGYEDILALLTVFMLLFFAVPALTILIYLIFRWKHKKWTFRSIWQKLMERFERWKEKLREKKKPKDKKPIMITFDEEENDEKE
ncbi:MAG: ABC transporter permease [Lachnospiraceae bacterium]|nr:ABC transporter permease [Lachnospiraceae bacterium]